MPRQIARATIGLKELGAIRKHVESSFARAFKDLPDEIKRIAQHALDNPRAPQYHLKKLRPFRNLRKNSWSVRITNQDYRAICTVIHDDFIWYFIGTHAQYDRLTGR